MLSSDCVKLLSESHNRGQQSVTDCYGIKKLQSWIEIFEDSLIVMKWLSKKTHNWNEIYSKDWYNNWVVGNDESNIPNGNYDNMSLSSPAQTSMIDYLDRFKTLVNTDKGNGTKVPKFHLMLHNVRNICCHGSICNFDGSCPEAIAKELAKSPGLQTQRHHKSIALQTASR